MPIQIYRPRVQEQGLPNVRQRGTDRIAKDAVLVARGTEQAVSGVVDLRQRVVAEQDQAAIQSAHARLLEAKQRLLEDPDEGFIHRRGKDAIAGRDQYLQNLKHEYEALRGEMNPHQSEVFSRIWERESLSYKSTLDRHTARQSEVVSSEANQAVLDAAVQSAVSAAQTGDEAWELEAADSIGRGSAAIKAMGDAKGLDPDTTQHMIRKHISDVQVGVLTTLTAQDRSREAKAYLAANRDDIDPRVLPKVEALVNASGTRDLGRAIADDVWEEAGGDPLRAQDVLRSRKIDNTDVFDEALKRIQSRGSQIAAATRQADAPRVARLEQALREGGGFSKASEDYILLSDEGKATALRMRDAERRSRRTAGAEARRAQAEMDRYLLALYDGLDLVGEDGADKVTVDVDGPRFADGSPTMREALRARQKKAQRDRAKDQGVSATEFKRTLEARLSEEMGLGKKARKEIQAHANMLYDKYLNDPKNAGIPPPTEVVDSWIADWFIRGERGRSAGFLQPNMLKIQAEIKGVPFEAFEGGSAPTRAQPRVRKIILKGPEGQLMEADPSPELDAWLRDNPAWSVQ